MTALAAAQGTLLILLLAWKAAHLARTPRNVPLRWVVACLAFATIAFVAQLPSASLISPVRSWQVFLQFSLVLDTSWALNCFFVAALRDAADARRIAVRRAFGLIATVALMAVATALVPPGASIRDQSVPAVAVVYLLFMAANAALLADALRHTLRGIAGCGPILARGLRLVSAGFILMIVALVPLTVLVAMRWARLPAPTVLLTAGALVAVLGIVVFLAGVLYPGAVMRLSAVRVRARHYRQYRQLAPLWNELYRAFPQDALTRVPSSPWLERITPWGVDRRYYRRVIECRDGLVRVSPRLMVPGGPQPLADRLLTALRTVPAAREARGHRRRGRRGPRLGRARRRRPRTRRPRPPARRHPPPDPVLGWLVFATTGELVTKVLIIGAGIAGPAAAIALRKAGISSEIYEAYPADAASPGAFVTIPSNGQDALDAIDAGELFSEISFPTTRLRFLKPDGELMGEFPLGRKRPAPRSVIRSDLARALTAEASRLGVLVFYGKRLVSVDHDGRGVTAVFDDGTRASGDVLVGADGIHSVVRDIIDPDAPPSRYTGLTVATGYADGSPGIADEPGTTTMIYGSRAYLGCIAAPDGRRWWFTRLPGPELSADELAAPADQTRERIAAAFDDDPTPAADIVRATPGPITITSARDIPALPTWHNGLMVLIGDAAHAVSPATTQGASMALEDAVTLAKCLRDIPDVPDALASYEHLRRERAERICQTGAEAGTNPVPPVPGARQEGPPAWIFDHHIDWSAPVRA